MRDLCVFTTHTPVEAGHDRFSYDLVGRIATDLLPIEALKVFGGPETLNMTQVALHLTGYVNGVAQRHAITAREMFPGFDVRAVTNGVHVGTWAHPAFAALYQSHYPQWSHEPEVLVRADRLPDDDLWEAHERAKLDLRTLVRDQCGIELDVAVPIIGFARRMTGYKRPDLVFSDLPRLAAIAKRYPFQLVFSGKAHPADSAGKEGLHGCAYSMAHSAEAAHRAGVSDEKIAAILDYRTSPLFTDAERVAIEFAVAAASQPNAVTEAHFVRMRRHWNEGQIVEIAGVVALNGFLNRWNDTMAPQLEREPLAFATAHLAAQGWKPGKHQG